MRSEVLIEYINIVRVYYQRLQALYRFLEPSITLQPFIHNEINFIPSESTVTRQISRWPDGVFRYPPGAWITQRKGTFTYKNNGWSFAFHGGGITFIQDKTELDISGEFTNTGLLAITEYTIWCYLASRPKDEKYWAEMGSLNELYFKEMEALNLLLPIPPLIEGSDYTYIIPEMST